MYSDCCGAFSEMPEIDLCPECLEHCEFIDDEEEEEDYYSGLLYGVDNNQ
jgi:hypothetical protein